jgi:hypothetical protein
MAITRHNVIQGLAAFNKSLLLVISVLRNLRRSSVIDSPRQSLVVCVFA